MRDNVDVKIKINAQKIKKQYDVKQQKALRMLKSEIAKDTEPFVPMKDGQLRRSVTKNLRTNLPNLIWSTVYSRFLYYAKVMVGRTTRRPWAKKGETKEVINKDLTYSQPGTGGRWFEKSKKVKLQKWILMAKRVYKR